MVQIKLKDVARGQMFALSNKSKPIWTRVGGGMNTKSRKTLKNFLIRSSRRHRLIEDGNTIVFIKQPEFYCPDCDKPLTFISQHSTDWYGLLNYYRCTQCKTDLVSRNGETPEILANS
jgi:hypothetical protein